MIQAVMLIALGFMSAGLIGVLIAPALWHRAARLSRKRLEQTLPVTLSEIEAAQDRLRASYAVRIRRLETALAGAKQSRSPLSKIRFPISTSNYRSGKMPLPCWSKPFPGAFPNSITKLRRPGRSLRPASKTYAICPTS